MSGTGLLPGSKLALSTVLLGVVFEAVSIG